MVKFEPAPPEPVEESTLLPARAVTEGSPCLRDGRLEVPHLMVTLRAEGPGPEPSVALTCESTQLLRCLQKAEDGGRCERPSLVFLQKCRGNGARKFRLSFRRRGGVSLRRCYRRRRRHKNAGAATSGIRPVSQKRTRVSGVWTGVVMSRSSTLVAVSAGVTTRRAITSP